MSAAYLPAGCLLPVFETGLSDIEIDDLSARGEFTIRDVTTTRQRCDDQRLFKNPDLFEIYFQRA